MTLSGQALIVVIRTIATSESLGTEAREVGEVIRG